MYCRRLPDYNNCLGGLLMKITTRSGFVITLCMLVSLAACSGGGGSSAPVPPTKAVITLTTLSMTGSLPAGTLIYGAEATVNLPAGVTVKASPSSENPQVMVTDNGVVSASGQAAGAETYLATYLASSTTPTTYKVELSVAKSIGFLVGEFVTVNCDITAGYSPAATDFTVTGFKAVDQSGVEISNIAVGFTAAIQ
jgi:hypothetical protein